MRYRAWVAAAACFLSFAFTCCSGSSDTRNTSAETPQADESSETPQADESFETPQAAESAESAEESTAAGGEPQPGTCWAVPTASVTDLDYWFDDSPQVPCTKPHTTETVTTYSLAEPTIKEAERLADYCWDDVRQYLGIDADSWVPWGVVVYLPSKEEVADGPGWMRCDAFFPTTTRLSSARTTNVSAKGVADAPPADFWACTDKPPAKGDQPFVSCDRPHNYEQTGTLSILDGTIEYPSAAERSAEARRQCRDGVPVGYDDVTVDAAWDPRSTYVAGTGLAGWCFIFYPDGRALPAR